MEYAVLCGVLFRFASTHIAVALHGRDGQRANGQHRSCHIIHFSRLCACFCLAIKEVIGKTSLYTATRARLLSPLSPAKILLLSLFHCDNSVPDKLNICGILSLLHTQMVSRLRYIAIWILLVLPSGSVSGQGVMEQVMFCRTDGRIVTDSCDMRLTAEWRDRIIADFLKYAATPVDTRWIDYCDSYCGVMMDDSTRISVDCVTFPSGDAALAKWLNDIPDSTYIEPDIPAEAPEKCIAFRKSPTLVIVWCNLFVDTDEVFRKIHRHVLIFKSE